MKLRRPRHTYRRPTGRRRRLFLEPLEPRLLLSVGHPALTNEPNAGVDVPVKAQIADDYANVPLSFEINQGQVDSEVDFLSRGLGYQFFLTDGNAVMQLKGDSPADSATSKGVLRIDLLGAASEPRAVGLDPLPTAQQLSAGRRPEPMACGC